MRDFPDSLCLCSTGGLRRLEIAGPADWTRLGTDDSLFCGQSGKHKLRCKQQAELGYDQGDEHRHHAGDLHINVGEWFDEREPNGDDDLYADSDECGRFCHIHCDHYRNRGEQANDHLFHCQPHEHQFGIEQ